ncbi:CapA family protein [Caloramator sp. CAR-1]|uniref:CapA family protein n=1 Tax=Caloramator sp. CAR-1 TaxID=3062777 RepID=UPI0026E474A6|nr:CapA family protein [Caloramator sp. CAR-1]MDO6355637.1 CapA family protein [Caloramator sp. CAR-1]
MKRILSFFLAGATLLLFLSCNGVDKLKEQQEKIVVEKPKKSAKIVMVGDVIFHKPQINSARTNKGYDFKPSFSEIKDIISKADYAVFNFEGNVNTKLPPSGYPNFNSPIEAIDALKWAGFDAVVLANNHSLDTGLDGLKGTLKNYSLKGIKSIGAGNQKDRALILDINGIKIGFLAYTQFINGRSSGLGYVNILDLKTIEKDIKNIKSNCDFCIVYLHYGTEYIRNATVKERELFRKIADLGADYIVGNHPHVVRESEAYKTKDGRWVIFNYSLGNFISNQKDKYTDIGLIVNLTLEKEDKRTYIKDLDLIPVYRLKFYEKGRLHVKTITLDRLDKYNEKINSEDLKYILGVSKEINMKNSIEVSNLK